MYRYDLNRVRFYSLEDMAGAHELSKGEKILRTKLKPNYTDVNDVLELYSIKKYIDNKLYLISWTPKEIEDFKQQTIQYGKIVGNFFLTINNENVFEIFEQILHDYIKSFWEIVCNHSLLRQISKQNFIKILENYPHLIHEILTYKALVNHYDKELKNFLVNYATSTEILLSVYETKDEFERNKKYIPKSLTTEDKETIILKYLDSEEPNLNYIGLIVNLRNKTELRITDKTRLKAKRLQKSKTDKFLAGNVGMSFGVSVGFSPNISKLKDSYIDDDNIVNYTFNSDFIKNNNHPYRLFQNFKLLFDFIDTQNRINLVSKKSQLGLFEKNFGVQSQNEYMIGTQFRLTEMSSQAQICGYNKIITELNTSLEEILHFVFTKAFQQLYAFADNARFSVPTRTNTFFEKVRLLAPEFESILKQFKLYVEDGEIDFELLQISSSPTTIKNIPSLIQDKYIYFNTDNQEMVNCSKLFFSDQTLLAYVDPFKNKKYNTFFDLLANEQVNFNNYEEFHKPNLSYLIERKFIEINNDGFIQVINPARLLIFKDLHDSEFASFYRYPTEFQKEVLEMRNENIVLFESTLFSKSEQSYFNYFLNKSDFTNGLDLRNSYLHGTQANPEEIKKHEYAYFTYLKLVVLTLLKIDDDLQISNAIKKKTNG